MTSGTKNVSELPFGEEYAGIHVLADEVREFLGLFKWCRSIEEIALLDGGDDKFGVFRCKISPIEPATSELWVIVGDVPPAIFMPDVPGDRVIERYVEHLEDWVRAVRNGESVDTLIPVAYRKSLRPVELTQEMADLVERKAKLVRKTFLEGE